ncbi:MAG: hypothetical protein GXP46_11120 [Deferribacteres bacterium]|nr:hypothetical protein [Deferribacteres bacterium]
MTLNDNHKIFNICLLLTLVLLMAAGAVLTGVSYLPFEPLKLKIDSYALYGRADQFTPQLFKKIAFNLRIIAIVLFITAGLLYSGRLRVRRYVSDLADSMVSFLKDVILHFREAAAGEDKKHIAAFLIIVVAAAAVRIFFLSVQPMTPDEAATFYAYASKPLFIGLTNYSAPNNHLFHTFLVHIAYLLFGNHPWVVRLPALIAGILVVPASYFVIRIFYNKHAALLTAGVLASLRVLIGYSTTARGYTMICLIFLSILALAPYIRQNKNHAAWLLFAVLSAIGFYTIPIMLYPFGTVVIWLLLSIVFEKTNIGRRDLLKNLFIYVIVTSVLTLILYTPVFAVSGIKSVIANRWVTARSWSYFAAEFPASLVLLWNQWNMHMPSAASIVLAAGFIASLVFHRQLSIYRVPIAVATVVWCLPVVAAQRVVPYNRVWLFLLPVYIGTASAGVVFLLNRIKLKKSDYHVVIFPFLVVVLSAWLIWNVVTPHYYLGKAMDNETITVFLKDYLKPGDRVVDFAGNEDPDPSMIYYFKLYDIPIRYLIADPNSSKRILVIINEKTDTLKERLDKRGIKLTKNTVPKLLRRYKVVSLYEIDMSDERSPAAPSGSP